MDIRFLLAKKYTIVAESGSELQLSPCPSCGDERGKLYFNITKKVGICFHCGETFNLYRLTNEKEDTSILDFPLTGSLASMTYEAIYGPQKVELSEKPPGLPYSFRYLDRDETPIARAFLAYLQRRGISRELVSKFRLGYCPQGFFSGRIIFPVFQDGVVKGFTARAISNDVEPKYLFPKGMRTGQLLYNYDLAKTFDVMVITEGVFDALSVGENAVATFGTHLSDGQVKLLRAAGVKQVIFAWDSDALCKSIREISRKLSGIVDIRLALFPEGKDPNDLLLEGGLGFYLSRAKPLHDYTILETVCAETLRKSFYGFN